MPIYTYACTSCGVELERRQSFSDAPLTTCEACGGDLRRVLHPVGVIFKGSGFYNTDYKKAASNGSAGSDGSKEGGASGEPKKSEPAKAESKPDSAPASAPSKADSGSKTPAATTKD